MFPFCILLELRMMEVTVTTTAIRRAKPSQILTTNKPTPSFYGPDTLPVAQPTASKNCREKYHIPRTCLWESHPRVFQPCLCLWLPWGRVQGLSFSPPSSVPQSWRPSNTNTKAVLVPRNIEYLTDCELQWQYNWKALWKNWICSTTMKLRKSPVKPVSRQ